MMLLKIKHVGEGLHPSETLISLETITSQRNASYWLASRKGRRIFIGRTSETNCQWCASRLGQKRGTDTGQDSS
jgi:hypothetical protein